MGGGRVDLVVEYGGRRYVIEVKAGVTPRRYEEGKRQLVEYLEREGLEEGWYVIFEEWVEESELRVYEEGGKKIHEWRIKTKYERPSKLEKEKKRM